ncbi:UNVERIFIED_CONTAM: hypothetical protein Sradi_6714600 [Sesamum radiatum]|uniref:EamA domain-containing protein n=1 Tax=Sesamum radiatum TaxID=300843 RepID=A0AAW2JQC3_SESRA
MRENQASNIPVVKEVEAIIDPEVFNLMRFAVAAIPFIPVVLQARDDANTRNAGIELGFWVVVVPLIDGMLGSAVPPRTWFGALMSIIGVAMLESSGSPPCVGDLLNFISALSFGIHMLRQNIFQEVQKEKISYHSLDMRFVLVYVSLADVYLVFGLLGGMAAMCDVSATETAIVYGLEPVWGAGFAWFLLGERWGVGGWIGAALVLGGSLTVQIMGATSNSQSRESKRGNAERDGLLIPDKQSSFSTSPIVVKNRKNNPT